MQLNNCSGQINYCLIKQFQQRLTSTDPDFATADDFNNYFIDSVEEIVGSYYWDWAKL